MTPKPLATAALRFRGKPGRPKKALPTSEEELHGPGGLTIQTVAPVPPRLLDLPATAAYLGVSEWTIRDLESAGVLRRVRVPLPNHGELRKLLFDREDLDHLIAVWKESR